MTVSEFCDCVIVGDGIDALVCAAYLSRGGCKTVLVTQRVEEDRAAAAADSGGPAPFGAGSLFRYGPAIRELNLRGHGFAYRARPAVRVSLHPDGDHVVVTGNADEVRRELHRFSPADADAYTRYFRAMRRLGWLVRRSPQGASEAGVADRAAELRAVLRQAARLPDRELITAAAVLCTGARSLLDSWFASDRLKAFLAGEALSGAGVGPSTQGSAGLLLDHALHAPVGEAAPWLRAVDGWAGAHKAVEAAALACGVTVHRTAQAQQITRGKGGRCTVALSDGGTIEAAAVVHTLDPRSLLHLLDDGVLPDGYRSVLMDGDFAMPFAEARFRLRRLPRLRSRAGAVSARSTDAQFSVGPTLDYLDSAHSQACRGSLPLHPYIECRITAADVTAGPAGGGGAAGEEGAVLHARVQCATRGQGAASWRTVGPCVTQRALAALEPHWEGLSSLVEESWALSPEALEREALLRGEAVGRGGTLPSVDPLLRAPALFGGHRTPLQNLYVYGASGTGTATPFGATGRTVARLVLDDLEARGGAGAGVHPAGGGRHA